MSDDKRHREIIKVNNEPLVDTPQERDYGETMPHLLRNRLLQACAGLTLVTSCGAFAIELADQSPTFSVSTLAILFGAGLAVITFLRPSAVPFAMSQIVRQLIHIGQSRGEQVDANAIKPLASTDELSSGWRKLVHHVMDAEVRQRIELGNPNADANRSLADGDVLNTLNEGIGVSDINGRLTFVNNAMAALLGNGDDREGLNDKEFVEFLPRELPVETCEALRSPQPVSFESETVDEDQKTTLRWSRRPRIDDQGDLRGHIWTIRDVTQQKLADEMREQFVATATHELRTPLSNITAYAETLSMADDIDVEQQKQFYNVIQAEATRLSRFVDELLNVSRMEAGSMTLDKRETDLARLLNEVCDKVRAEAAKKNLTFNVTFPPKLPTLTVDKDKLAAALVNLIGNAVKYTPENGTVAFTVQQQGTEISFSVEDNGIGISEEELPKLFDKFFRSDDNRVREITGSGLGLSFTNEVAKLHHGRIDVDSVLNEGSTFTMILPVTRGPKK